MAVAYYQGHFPPETLDCPQLLPLIGPANGAVPRYESVLHDIRASSGRRPAGQAFPEWLNICEGWDAL